MKRFASCLAAVVFFSFAPVSFGQDVSSVEGVDTGDLEVVAGEVESKINSLFTRIDSGLSNAAAKLSQEGIEKNSARDILTNLYKKVPYVIDCSVLDASGKMVVVEPKDYASVEGNDVSEQEHVIKLHETEKPVFSNTFLAVEGFSAVDFEYPVFSAEKGLVGSVSALVRSEALLAGVTAPIIEGKSVHVWVMQLDGLVLYDSDRDQIGKNVFSDPLYKPFPTLVSLCERMLKEKSGSGSYNFINRASGKPVVKNAVWVTVGLYDNEWRVVAVKEQS